ncbi:MAG: VTT domain-containing protein, partial [Nitratireductor sp.]|nr:VTT domain-containing protein [Nitratireductor sp.]
FGDFLSARAGPFVTRMLDGFNKDAFNYLLSLRLTPVFPFWVVNIVPALLNMRFGPYLAATFLGIIPGTLAYSYIGSGLDSIIVAQELANPGCAAAGTCSIDPSSLVTRQIILAMVGLAVISILPVLYKKFRAKAANT